MTPDFIIIGAGSAGSVLADRLSASGKFKVLVLEAGGTDRRFYIQMPLGYGKTFYDPAVNWLYKTEADPGLNGQQDHWPRGKVWGGSSAINAMVYIRGHQADYEDWAKAGNPGWGWDDVLPIYKAMEDNGAGGDQWRGTGGPLHVHYPIKQVHPLTQSFVEASTKLGLKFNPDFNGAEQEGVGIYQVTIKDGIRNSAARAFLRPALKRPNVKIESNCLAEEVLFENNRAVGVRCTRGGQTLTFKCTREVIIAGGAVNSPQLLQLSGIGPGTLLRQHGIRVRAENANVGANLEDHQGINYTYRMKVKTLNNVLRPWHGKLRVGLQWLLTRKGPLSTSINHGGGFFRTRPELDRPNMQLYFQAFSTLKPANGERPILNPDPFAGMSIGLSNCRPTSRGSIMIQSADARQHPRITGNVYSTEQDVADMLAAVKFVRNIASQEPLAHLIAEELRPGPAAQTDDELIDDFRQRSGTVYHPSCTCRMGPDERTSVVSPTLKVHKVDGLRVIDASAFPSLIAGNTNAPAIMIGWKGADIILADHQ